MVYSYLIFPLVMKNLSNKTSLNFNQSFFPKVAVIMSAYQEEFIIKEKLKSDGGLAVCFIAYDQCCGSGVFSPAPTPALTPIKCRLST